MKDKMNHDILFRFAELAGADYGPWVYREDLQKWQHMDDNDLITLKTTKELFEFFKKLS